MKLHFMKHCLSFQGGLILLLNLPLGGAAWAAGVTAQQAEANAVITSFAMDSFKSELPASEFSAWPVPLRDSLIYSLGSRPSADWSLELRQFVLAQFRRHATDLENDSHPDGQVKTWLQRPDPWKDTNLVFYLNPALDVETPSQHFQGAQNFDLFGGNSEEAQPLSRILSSLSAKQKAELFAAHGRLLQSELTEQQMAAVKQILHSDRNFGSMNGVPTRPFDQKDTTIGVGVIFQALVQDMRPGVPPQDFYETVLARPLNPPSSAM